MITVPMKYILASSLLCAGSMLPATSAHTQNRPEPPAEFGRDMPKIPNETRLTEADVAWSRSEGDNTIYGVAFIPKKPVSAKSLAAGKKMKGRACRTVSLIPRSAYADERMMHTFGNLKNGYLDNTVHRLVSHQRKNMTAYEKKRELKHPNSNIYSDTTRNAKCYSDDSGNKGYFKFSNIPDGEYYLTTRNIDRGHGRLYDFHFGGLQMTRISVANGQTLDVNMVLGSYMPDTRKMPKDRKYYKHLFK